MKRTWFNFALIELYISTNKGAIEDVDFTILRVNFHSLFSINYSNWEGTEDVEGIKELSGQVLFIGYDLSKYL